MTDQESKLLELSDGIVPLVWENPAELTPAERVFVCIWQLEAEVNNGGFYQYYSNSAGDLAADTPAALEAIGAMQTAVIVKGANGLFPGGPPEDRDARCDMLDALDDNLFEQFDTAFLRYDENLSQLLYDFVQRNRGELRGA